MYCAQFQSTDNDISDFSILCNSIAFPIDYLFISTHGVVPWEEHFGCLNFDVETSCSFDNFIQVLTQNIKILPQFIYFNSCYIGKSLEVLDFIRKWAPTSDILLYESNLRHEDNIIIFTHIVSKIWREENMFDLLKATFNSLFLKDFIYYQNTKKEFFKFDIENTQKLQKQIQIYCQDAIISKCHICNTTIYNYSNIIKIVCSNKCRKIHINQCSLCGIKF